MRGVLLVALSVVWYLPFSFTLYLTPIQLNAGAVVFGLLCSSWLVCLCGLGSIPEFSARAGAPRYLS